MTIQGEGPEKPLSPLSKAIADALFEAIKDDEVKRAETAQEYGLPPNSTWGQIGEEARKKSILNHREIVKKVSKTNPELATKLERCFTDGIPLMQHWASKPENPQARLAAGIFLYNYRDLKDCVSKIKKDYVSKIKPDDRLPEEVLSQFTHTAWELYENYGSLQNTINRTGYTLDEQKLMQTLPRS